MNELLKLEKKKEGLKEFLNVEKKAHDTFYAGQSAYERSGDINFNPEVYERNMAYPWQTNFNLYSEETLRFVRYIKSVYEKNRIGSGSVLEYGCGRGDLSCYLALKGWKEIHGFDLSGKAIEFAQRLAQSCGLQDRVFFQVMNAQSLKYPNEKFGLVVGHGVLHHISKYPGTASELYRVMKPGATAIFLENLGNGPIWRLIRRITMGDTDFGDINLSTEYLKDWSSSFSGFKIRGFHVLFMAKRFCFIRRDEEDGTVEKNNRFKGLPWWLIRMFLSGCYFFDELVFNHTPLGNYFGGMCIITLRK